MLQFFRRMLEAVELVDESFGYNVILALRPNRYTDGAFDWAGLTTWKSAVSIKQLDTRAF